MAETYLGANVKAAVSYAAKTPMVTGIRKVSVWMPAYYFTDDEMKMALLHEYQHVKDGDMLVKLFYLLVRAFFWWNPLIHRFQKELEHLLELQCDAKVVKNMTDEEKVFYLETILKVVKKIKQEESCISPSAFVNFHTREITKQRFELILSEKKKNSRWKQVFYAVLITVCFIGSYFVIIQPSTPLPPIEEIPGYVEITKENSYLLKTKEGRLVLYINGEQWDDVTEEKDMEPYVSLIIKEEEL